MAWTPAANTLRSHLATWLAALRKADMRAREAAHQVHTGLVPIDDAHVIAQKFASDNNLPVELVRAALGLPNASEAPQRPAEPASGINPPR